MTTNISSSRSDTQLYARRRRPIVDMRRNSEHCPAMPHTSQFQGLDLTSTDTLASIRMLVLSYLADLEAKITQADTPALESWMPKGEDSEEEAKAWSTTALEMLENIRNDVCSHLPEVKSHLPEMQLPDLELPDLNFRAKLDEVCATFQNIDIAIPQPLSYVPQLSEHLQNLQSHLSAIEMHMPDTGARAMLSDMLDSLLNSELVQEILNNEADDDDDEGDDDVLSAAAVQAVHIAHAVKRSFEGSHLISIDHLPHAWRNNPFVRQGYRFIPIEKWPLIILSIFALHNETLNIYTHLVPFLTWLYRSIKAPFDNADTPEMLFMAFALLCLGTSAVWHVMAGCAHANSMEFCARLDYVGIGWLISASVGTIVYYGFSQCHDQIGNSFLLLCLMMGIAGTFCPFMKWFNEYEYRNYRIAFFLALSFSALGPLAGLAMLEGWREMIDFIRPVFPSLISYLTGLFFYTTHAPECLLSEKWSRRLDRVGGVGSHAIWHCFIVLAVGLHRKAIGQLKGGFGKECDIRA